MAFITHNAPYLDPRYADPHGPVFPRVFKGVCYRDPNCEYIIGSMRNGGGRGCNWFDTPEERKDYLARIAVETRKIGYRAEIHIYRNLNPFLGELRTDRRLDVKDLARIERICECRFVQ